MIDSRIYTFLELCNVMNYHKTAENLNMTQPAVTQHIKYLENFYGCKLFTYTKKKLQKTEKCADLEKYARTIISLNMTAKQNLAHGEKTPIKIGATKTIGEYMLTSALRAFFADDTCEINIMIDNTERLLDSLLHFELDLLMIEGYVNKEKYKHKKIASKEIVGICAKSHPFANKEVALNEIFNQNTVLRESGSGTRAVFESYLTQLGYSVEAFKHKSVISSNKLIEKAVENGLAISFVYSIIPENNSNIAIFRIANTKISHEFNYIFLNEKKVEHTIALLEQNI